MQKTSIEAESIPFPLFSHNGKGTIFCTFWGFIPAPQTLKKLFIK
jgi:hypothetical protein